MNDTSEVSLPHCSKGLTKGMQKSLPITTGRYEPYLQEVQAALGHAGLVSCSWSGDQRILLLQCGPVSFWNAGCRMQNVVWYRSQTVISRLDAGVSGAKIGNKGHRLAVGIEGKMDHSCKQQSFQYISFLAVCKLPDTIAETVLALRSGMASLRYWYLNIVIAAHWWHPIHETFREGDYHWLPESVLLYKSHQRSQMRQRLQCKHKADRYKESFSALWMWLSTYADAA